MREHTVPQINIELGNTFYLQYRNKSHLLCITSFCGDLSLHH